MIDMLVCCSSDMLSVVFHQYVNLNILNFRGES